MTAGAAARPWTRAVLAPVTQKSASPAASSTSIGPPIRLRSGWARRVTRPAPAGDGKVTPVTDGGGRDADQQVVGDAAGEADNHGEHDDAEEVEPCAHAAMPPLSPNANVPARLRTSSSIWFLLGVHQRGRQSFWSEHAIAGRA
jgi:hypothetical protein